MSERSSTGRIIQLTVIGTLMLSACSEKPPASEHRTPIGVEQERVTEYRYPGTESRDIATHTEDHSGWLDARSYDLHYHQYCDKPPDAPADSPNSALVSTRVHSNLPKFGGNKIMQQILLDAPECVDGTLNQADEGTPNASPIPPNGPETDMGSVNNWEPPK